MRVDKYLWALRYFKTRSLASTACRKGQVRVNDLIAKSSREVYPSDKIMVRKDQIDYQLKIIDLPDSRVGAKLVNLYREDITPEEAFQHSELLSYSKAYYRQKGTGRPTKKDRRDIDEYLDESE